MGTTSGKGELRRVLGTGLLVLYGLGTVIGAGIYVLIGAVADVAGMSAPLSFILAGAFAALTGLSYAELAVRYPEAAGASAYVGNAFQSPWAARLTGLMMGLVILVASASIARGVSGYAEHAFGFPGPLVGGILVIFFTGVACLGVKQSVGFSAVLTIFEISGLVFVVAVAAPDASAALFFGEGEMSGRIGELVPATWSGWQDIAVGAFLAYFAFLGFESMANMAEETRNKDRTLPVAIIVTIVISAVLYALVVLIGVLSVSPERLAGATAPLAVVVEGALGGYGRSFAAFAILATVNGVLIDILMLSRLMYGMAHRRWLPRWLSSQLTILNPKSKNPERAVLLAGGLVFVTTLALPFATLVALTSALTLVVFTAVNIALIRVQMTSTGPRPAFSLPRALPPLGAAACLGLLAAEIFRL